VDDRLVNLGHGELLDLNLDLLDLLHGILLVEGNLLFDRCLRLRNLVSYLGFDQVVSD